MIAVDTRAGVDFDLDALGAWLKDWLGGSARTEARQTEGGMSNPTYFLKRGDWRAVLRKQPRAALAPSAHAIDREFRVLEALQGTPVPTPKPFRYCADREVLGTPFYLMEWLDGRVFHEFATPGVTRTERTALYRSMCATLAEITSSTSTPLVSRTLAGRATIFAASFLGGRACGRNTARATTTIPASTASSAG
jgi:aminoglycoside phosphotransferase (APT) family kinase protein